MNQCLFPKISVWGIALLLLTNTGCTLTDSVGDSSSGQDAVLVEATADLNQILAESWDVYRQEFIQPDGRVIDFEAGDRTVSEGQAYAMIRAVLTDDPETFERTLTWAEDNLRRQQGDTVIDQLWGWKWGQLPDGQWGLVDPNFASDADIDAAFALILAAERWQNPDYLDLAKIKLKDIWVYSTIEVDGDRYLLPGPRSAFQSGDIVYLNPSYLAPYAFRLFAQVDPAHDWQALVDTSYEILEESAAVSAIGLPGDWVAFDQTSGEFKAIPQAGPFNNQYGFDAYRVWWRIGWDAVLFEEPRAARYLASHLQYLEDLWLDQQMIPAEFDIAGNALVDYDAIAQYAMVYAGFRETNPAIAAEIYQRKIMSQYQAGIWDNPAAYYSQNLVWLGLFPPAALQDLMP